jgi:hypothetical protein
VPLCPCSALNDLKIRVQFLFLIENTYQATVSRH